MPTYEYQCPEGHAFERIQKISDRQRRARCPECGRLGSRKISGGAGLLFKGSGFYITDYGKDGKGPRKAEQAEGGSKPAKSESPPASPKKEAGSTPKPKGGE